MRSVLLVVGRIALTAGLIAAAVWSVRLSWADYCFRQGTVLGTQQAIQATPGQAALYYRLALLESDENGRKATEALQRATALNPSDGPSWVELGLRYEAEHNDRLAEQCLLRAAEENAEYLPRWTLANYYFRHNNVDRFWYWAKQSADRIYDDPLPFFRLCGRAAGDGDWIDRMQLDRPDIRAGYLSYLLAENRLDRIGTAARNVLIGKREADVPLLEAASDALLQSNRVAQALHIWNGLVDAHAVPFGRLAAEGTVLTNGDFTTQPTSQGFDWRLPDVDGLSVASEENPAGLRVTFSGRQPEQCEPIFQYVPVREHTEYRLRYAFRTSGIRAGSGLHWRITDMNRRTLESGESLSSEADAQSEVSFVTPADCQAIRLSLAYERAPGTTRIDGFLILRQVEIKPTR
jgi:hypothetical protein